MPAQNYLRAQQLHATRGRKTVFEKFDIDIRSGDIVQVLGANGSGKSTLLRIIASLAAPDEGAVLWNDRDIHREATDEFRHASLYIGHKSGLSGDQTANENLELFRRINSKRATLTAREALKKVAYSASPDVFINKVSAGQQQRVALAKLLTVEAPVWLLDEPFTALDKEGKHLIETLINTHCSNGGIALVATHQNLDLAADRIKNVHLS